MTDIPRRKLGSTELKRLHRDWRRRSPGDIALLLENVQSPFNVGAIVRSAAAFRVRDTWLVGATASPRNPKTQKTALGTDRYVRFHHAPTASEAIHLIRSARYTLIAVELTTDAVPLHVLLERVRTTEGTVPPLCLAFGNEEHGLTSDCLSASDRIAYVPQLGKIGSLNVATAAAIALYEVHRSGWTATTPPVGQLPPMEPTR
ncbi:MAG: hypothetical protein N2037_14135 [Acidimicrobiales bacterium]|nr:hypothetical protein [Acidimicrobiales bacterium]